MRILSLDADHEWPIHGPFSRGYTVRAVLFDLGRFLALCFRPRAALAAENLFLRKQLALFEARKAHPQRAPMRFVMSCPLCVAKSPPDENSTACDRGRSAVTSC
jgi:hypothetical protein